MRQAKRTLLRCRRASNLLRWWRARYAGWSCCSWCSTWRSTRMWQGALACARLVWPRLAAGLRERQGGVQALQQSVPRGQWLQLGSMRRVATVASAGRTNARSGPIGVGVKKLDASVYLHMASLYLHMASLRTVKKTSCCRGGHACPPPARSSASHAIRSRWRSFSLLIRIGELQLGTYR